MELFRIYGKTELGIAALNAARGAIPSSARQLLILIDGQRTVGELQGIFGEDALGKLLPQLEVQGYVKYLRDSPPPRPATISGTRPATISGARPPTISVTARRPELAAPATAAASGTLVAKSVLALGVLAVSGALWWFLGQPHLPGIGAAPDTTANAPVAASASTAAEPPAPEPVAPVPPLATVGFDRATQRNREPARPDARSAAPAATPAKPAANAGAPAGGLSTPADTPRVAAPATTAPAPAVGASLAAGTPVAVAPDGSVPPSAPPAAAKAPASVPATNGAPAPASAASQVAAAPVASTQASAANAAAPTAATPAPAAAKSTGSPGAPPGPVLHPRERTMPVLSKNARRAGVDSGELVVRLHVTARGTVEAIDVVKANPRQVYDLTIEQTLKKWTFDPPGAPAESTVEFFFKP